MIAEQAEVGAKPCCTRALNTAIANIREEAADEPQEPASDTAGAARSGQAAERVAPPPPTQGRPVHAGEGRVAVPSWVDARYEALRQAARAVCVEVCTRKENKYEDRVERLRSLVEAPGLRDADPDPHCTVCHAPCAECVTVEGSTDSEPQERTTTHFTQAPQKQPEQDQSDGLYLVVRKRDDAPAEIYPFYYRPDAESMYARASEQWTETYLCRAMKGPRDVIDEAQVMREPSEYNRGFRDGREATLRTEQQPDEVPDVCLYCGETTLATRDRYDRTLAEIERLKAVHIRRCRTQRWWSVFERAVAHNGDPAVSRMLADAAVNTVGPQ